jgi:hypothetical protein
VAAISIITVVVGVAAVFIAYLQWRTAVIKLNLETFDRRHKVYEGVIQYCVACAAAKDVPPREEQDKFYSSASVGPFILPEESGSFVDDLLKLGLRFATLQLELDKAGTQEEKDTILGEIKSVRDKMLSESCKNRAIFEPALTLDRGLFSPLKDGAVRVWSGIRARLPPRRSA